jgi:hypothetical protein
MPALASLMTPPGAGVIETATGGGIRLAAVA